MRQTAETKYWPDDDEVRNELVNMPIYRKISRSRLRMVLEAIEDHQRGYRPGGKKYAGMRVRRNTFWIEHIMPQAWETSWPEPTAGTVHERAQRIHTLGNLTLLTARLNGAVSNGPWAGDNGKKAALRRHDVLLLNRDLDLFSTPDWTDDSINRRTRDLINTIVDIWPVPPGYKDSTISRTSTSIPSIDLSDLLSAGLLSAGQMIVPKHPNLRDRKGQILPDGRIDIDGRIFDTPSGAGYHLRKRATNGWSFWLVDPKTKKSLASIRREYFETSSLDANGIDDEDDEAVDDTTDNLPAGVQE